MFFSIVKLVLVFDLADLAGGLEAIKNWHDDVHKDEIKQVAIRYSLGDDVHGLLSVLRDHEFDIHLGQVGNQELDAERVVFNNEHLELLLLAPLLVGGPSLAFARVWQKQKTSTLLE